MRYIDFPNITFEMCPKFEMFGLYNFSLSNIAWMSIILSNESIKEIHVMIKIVSYPIYVND